MGGGPPAPLPSPGDVEALVLAAGRGERLGRGPKALLVLDGRSLLARAVEVAGAVAARVIVGAPPDHVDECRALLGSAATVVPGGPTRTETELRLFEASSAPWLVLHDVVHPFASAELARRVLARAREDGAAMAAVRIDAHVFRAVGAGVDRVPSMGPLWSSRKPLAFPRSALARGVAELTRLHPDAGMAEILEAGGAQGQVVADEPWNIKLTTEADWVFAQALAPLVSRGRLRPPPPPPSEPSSPRRAEGPRAPRAC